MRHPLTLPLTLAALIGGALAAQAGPGAEGFDRLDRDHSGTISRAEFLALREQMFAALDTDGSGTLSRAEVEAARQRQQSARAEQVEARLRALDTNGDGQVTLGEYTAQTRGFDLADRNGDGQISRAEFDRVARFIAQARN